jgi:hypothetical protein
MGGKLGGVATATLLCCGILSSCGGPAHGASPTATSTQPSSTTAADEALAVKALHTWLAHPVAGTLAINSVDTDLAHQTVVSRHLLGRSDLSAGTATLTGTRTTLTASTTQQVPLEAFETGGQVYTSAAMDQNTTHSANQWLVGNLASVRASGSTHSIWWEALSALQTVHVGGPSEVDGKSAVEYTGKVDLAKLPSTANLVASSPIFRKAGTTTVSIDIYTDLGTGSLAQLTYRLGLRASVDSVATSSSTAGYEVDLSSFGAAPASPTPTTVPSGSLVKRGGNGELCRLLLF